MSLFEELLRAMHQKRLLAQGIGLVCVVHREVIPGDGDNIDVCNGLHKNSL